MKSVRIAAAFAMLALGAATPGAHAQSQAEDAALDKAATAYNADVENEQEKVVCKWEAQTGTRIKRKVCRTQAVIDAERENAERFVKKPRPVYTDE